MQLPVLRVLDGKSKVWLRRERMGKEMLFPFHVLFGTWPEILCCAQTGYSISPYTQMLPGSSLSQPTRATSSAQSRYR